MNERKQITLRLPSDLYERLRAEAERKGMQINEVINIILYDHYF